MTRYDVAAGRADVATVAALLQAVAAQTVVERVVAAVVASATHHVGASRAVLALPGDAESALAEASDAAKLALPLLCDGRVLGVLCLGFATPAEPLPDQVFLAELLASQAAVSIAQAERHQDAESENREHRRAAAESERVQTALKESEARFRSMADTTPDIIWITQLQPEQVVYASPSFERIFGKTVADLYANPHLWIEGIHVDDRDRVGASFGAWIESGSAEAWEVEFRVVHPNGSVRWIHDRGVLMRGASGPQRVSGIATDITERRLAEAALRESEQRYALAMEAARDGHWDWIAEGDDFYASPRMLEIYGFPPETRFAGRQDFLARFPFHPEDKPRWEAAAEQNFGGDAARFQIEIRLLRHGEVRWIHTTGLIARDQAGRPTRYTGSVSDITVRKAAEAALRESEQRFALVVAGSTDGIWDWDLASDRMFLSEQAQRLYGLRPESSVRSRAEWRALTAFHPDDGPLHDAMIDAYLAGRRADYDGEFRVVHADGSHRWLRLRGICVHDASGTPTRMAGSVNDIDFRRRAEAALQQTQRLEALGTLAGGIAHDFNNILGAILGFGEMALRDARAGSRVRRDIESMLTAGERGRSLVERILAFSRTGVGERVPVQLETVVREALDMVAAGLPADIDIAPQLAGGRAAVLGDATQLHQVVMNLATNAIQAMATGGMLGVTLGPVALAQPTLVTTGSVAAGDYLLLAMRDTGCGMTPDVLSRAFDPFFTTKDVGTGTGLGLSIVHGIVAELGGAIDVATSVGAGSTVSVYLPRFGDAPEAAEPAATTFERGRGEQVLLVDDEAALLQLMAGTLHDLGYVPAAFSSGDAALAHFRTQPDRFDAVVTDERMPGLSGVELIRALREIRPGLPVVMVSGYLGAGIERLALEAGADAVLRKPLVTAELATALARALPRPAPSRAPRRPSARRG